VLQASNIKSTFDSCFKLQASNFKTMAIELIVFISAILFGILLYWRESNGNGLYKFVNKIVNSKELQMDPSSKKGFIFKQSFLLRLVFVVALFLVLSLIVQFLTPFKIFSSYNGVSTFASSILGTLIGTYVANFVIKSGVVIEDKTGDLESIVSDVVEKGKDLVEDVKDKASDVVDEIKSRTGDVAENVSETIEDVKETTTETIEKTEKSARERLKDKGLM
jgi:methyl-accepting chemotaxis protein